MLPFLTAASSSTLPDWVQWVGALGPAATLLVGTIAGAVALGALLQRKRADAKAEWWRRTQWAFDQVLSGDEERKAVGAGMLVLLAQSELASKEDLDLFQAAWDDVLDRVAEEESGAVEYVVDEGSEDQ